MSEIKDPAIQTNAFMTIAVRSLACMVSSSIFATIAHETAHFITAKLLGVDAVLHANYVSIPPITPERHKVWIALAGPIFSLMAALSLRLLRLTIKSVRASLFALWMEVFNMLLFLGYLFITPVAHKGDLGKMFAYCTVPIAVQYGISAVSFIILNKLMCSYGRAFPAPASAYEGVRHKMSKCIFFYPTITFVPLMTLLNLPVISWVSLLPTLLLPISFFKTMACYRRLKVDERSAIQLNNALWPMFIFVSFSIIIFRLIH